MSRTGIQDQDTMLGFLDAIEGDVTKLDDDGAPETEGQGRSQVQPEKAESKEKLPRRGDDDDPSNRSQDLGEGEGDEEDIEAAAEDGESDDAGTEDEEEGAGADADTEELDAAEFASFFGLDESDLVVQEDGTVAFKYKVGEETGAATLKDLVRGYQLERNLNQKSERLSEELKGVHDVRQQYLQSLDAQGDLLENLKAQVTRKYDETDWKALEEDDPGRAALLRQRMAEDFQNLDHQLQAARQKREEAIQQAVQEDQRRLQEFFETEERRFIEKVPEWGKAESRTAMAAEFKGYLSELGFNEQEMGALRDHRLMMMLRDAVSYRKSSAKLPELKKAKVRVPRRLKSSAPVSKKATDNRRKASALNRLRESGSDRDAAAAFLALGKV